jgi:hypothetical protein
MDVLARFVNITLQFLHDALPKVALGFSGVYIFRDGTTVTFPSFFIRSTMRRISSGSTVNVLMAVPPVVLVAASSG